MRREPFAFLVSGFLLILMLFGITVGIKESQRRSKLSYRIRHRVRRLRDVFGLT